MNSVLRNSEQILSHTPATFSPFPCRAVGGGEYECSPSRSAHLHIANAIANRTQQTALTTKSCRGRIELGPSCMHTRQLPTSMCCHEGHQPTSMTKHPAQRRGISLRSRLHVSCSAFHLSCFDSTSLCRLLMRSDKRSHCCLSSANADVCETLTLRCQHSTRCVTSIPVRNVPLSHDLGLSYHLRSTFDFQNLLNYKFVSGVKL